jgi:hypothetical protein
MIAAFWPHTSFFASKLPFPGLLAHTPAVAQPLAFVLALRTAAEATGHHATTGDQAGAPLAVPFLRAHCKRRACRVGAE